MPWLIVVRPLDLSFEWSVYQMTDVKGQVIGKTTCG